MKRSGAAAKLGNWETRGLDLGLAGDSSVVTSLDLFWAIWNEKIETLEEQGGEEGTENGEQRVEEFLKFDNEECTRDGRGGWVFKR